MTTPARMHDVTDETRSIVDLVLEYSSRRLLSDDTPLDKPLSAAELSRLAGRTIGEAGIGARKALGVFEHVLAPACITVDDPRFLSFIPSAPTKASAAFDVIVSASAIYGGSWTEGAGVVHAENEVLRWLAGEFGLPDGAGGVFVQGGTLGNLSALVTAREAARARVGTPPARWKIVCSVEAHSSMVSAARVMDVEVVGVPTDEGVLRGDAVRAALEEHGDSVFAVVATAGSTNFGIVDDIADIADAASDRGVWLHVDGAYGLSAMLAPAARGLFAGVERADSLIVDPHKWLFAPFDACALIYRDPEQGRRAHTQHAEYLDTLTETGEWNPSDFAVHLTRRPRGLPLWFSLATYGAAVYRDAIGYALELAQQIASEIEGREGLRLVRRPQLGVVVFERIGWDKADYDRWSAQLLDSQQAFVAPSSHGGTTN
ncbi:MAG: aminotransferase class V-fold PLP-dependent enzyme, partial [Microbacterium sp.]